MIVVNIKNNIIRDLIKIALHKKNVNIVVVSKNTNVNKRILIVINVVKKENSAVVVNLFMNPL
jgi:hypothetical protein